MSLLWMYLCLNILNPIRQSYVEGLRPLDVENFGPKLKGTVKTIEALECGDIIDCVDFYKQPAFDNPLIENKKMDPSLLPSGFNKTRNHHPKVIQTWRKYGECPKGTVAIRRTLKNNSTRRLIEDDPKTREYATAFQSFNKGHGGKASLNVWKPQVEAVGEMSLSQLWISSGPAQELNTVEAGWIVHPTLYHDALTRLFIYWTSDNYDKTGCYNILCSGFVKTTNEIALGAALAPVSEFDEEPCVLWISLSRTSAGDWFLEVGDEILGYFPKSLFTSLGEGADEVAFGGEIVNLKQNNRHTKTTMGSGRFSWEGFKRASFISNIQVANENLEWVEPDLKVQAVTKKGCYTLTFGPSDTHLGSHIYFGGPGFSRRCK